MPCERELAVALETGRDNGWVFNLAALRELALGNPEGAETFMQEALKLLPEELTIVVNYAETLRQQGRLDEALILLNTGSPEALRAGANLLVEEGRHEEADEWYLKAQRKKPYDPELLADRAANCIEMDLLNEADDLVGRALDIKPSPRLYKLISYLASRKGEFTRSEVALQQGLTEFPNEPSLLDELCALYIATRRPEKALETADRLRRAGHIQRADEIQREIQDASTNKLSCALCGRQWRIPRNIPLQGSLHLTAEPPDELPAGTCPECGETVCIGCAKNDLGEDGRFRCRKCGIPLKLIDQNVIWLLNQWQATQG
jgi:tetratricopeptide (TPR) repeat protein